MDVHADFFYAVHAAA